MDGEHGQTEQGASHPRDTGTSSHADIDTRPSDEPLSSIIRALALMVISSIIGREPLTLAFEVILLAWVINRLESHKDVFDRRAADDRQARLEESYKRHLELLSEILETCRTGGLQVRTDDAASLETANEGTESETEETNGGNDEDVQGEPEEEAEESDDDDYDEAEWETEETDGRNDEEADREGGREVEREVVRETDGTGVNRERNRVVLPSVHRGVISSVPAREGLERDGRRLQQEEEQQTTAELNIQLPYPLMLDNPCTTCVGTTRQGARCRNSFIAGVSTSHAMRRIEIMKSANPGDAFEWEPLKELADWMLCPRWHRDKIPQGREIADRWYAELRPAREALARRHGHRDQNSTPGYIRGGYPSSSQSPSSVSSSPARDNIFTPTRAPLSRLETPPTSARPNPNPYAQERSSGRFGFPGSGARDPAVNLNSTFRALAAEAR